jgi:hypothetical protein
MRRAGTPQPSGAPGIQPDDDDLRACHADGFSERYLWVVEKLERRDEEHVIEGPGGEREPMRIAAHDRKASSAPSELAQHGCRGVESEGTVAGFALQPFGEVARAAADLEKRALLPIELEQ